MAETIGSANVILGADITALESGMATAKEVVQNQTGEIQKAADVTKQISDEERYLADLRQKALDALKERNAELVKTRELEAAAREAAAEQQRLADAQALSEEERYHNALLEKAIELEYARRDASKRQEQESQAAKQDMQAAKIAEAQAAQEALNESKRYEDWLLSKAIEKEEAKRAAAAASASEAKESAAAATADVPQDKGIFAFIKGASKEAQQLKKLLGTFGKLAIFVAAVKGAYELGSAIREYVITALESGSDKAKKFLDTLDVTNSAAALGKLTKQIDEVNEKIEAHNRSNWASLVGLMKGDTESSLIEERNKLQETYGRLFTEIEDRKKQARDKEIVQLRETIALETEQKRIALIEDPRLKAEEEFQLAASQLQKKADAEKDFDTRTSYLKQIELLKQEHDIKLANIQKEEDEKQASLDREVNDRIVAEKDDVFALQMQLADEKQKALLQYNRDIEELEKARIEAQSDEEEDAIIEQIELRKKLYQAQLDEFKKLDEKKADDDRKENEKRVQDARETALDMEEELLKGKEKLEFQYQRKKKEVLKKILDAQTKEERDALANQLQLLDEGFAKKFSDLSAQLLKQQQAAFGQLRGEINALFNTGTVEVGINKLGSLLEVLIQKTGDSR